MFKQIWHSGKVTNDITVFTTDGFVDNSVCEVTFQSTKIVLDNKMCSGRFTNQLIEYNDC